MLRKRTRSNPRNQNMNGLMTNSVSDSQFQSEIFRNAVFIGFNPGSSEFDSVRSPTSTLDFRVFSSFGNPFRLTRVTQSEGYQKKWDSDKVGLGIVESLDEESASVARSSDGKNIIFGRQMTIRSPNMSSRDKSLPVFRGNEKGGARVVFEIGCSGSSNFSVPLQGCTGTIFFGYVPAKEIEMSEDYTCVITRGPNPKVTHIFGDCILECPEDEVSNIREAGRAVDPRDDFLKFCYACRKTLDGEDIYMYRGEKGFCSYGCRLQEIEIDEEMEKAKHESSETPTNKTSGSGSRSSLSVAA